MASSNSATPLPGHEKTSKAATGSDGKEETLTGRSSCSTHLHSSNSNIPEIPDIPSPLLRPPKVKSAAVSASKYNICSTRFCVFEMCYPISYKLHCVETLGVYDYAVAVFLHFITIH